MEAGPSIPSQDTMGDAKALKELVERMAMALVDSPDQVTVDATEEDTAMVLRLRVAPSDVGRVIGKQGRTAKAMRTVLHAIAARSKRRAVLEILE
ncbi:KH domain-containing protein [Candidatus Methylomirabilis sp.]|uniref:RNA-binding protein KhpA n=1 Tax=Candidatus Methylomirabilis tolerans TaxID=3123416 RepID=A0AAJ1ES52_9BACT|nr:KH domain-containing protein [Candidatus Methylomirabilis sp.]